jgi:hypothetical protein
MLGLGGLSWGEAGSVVGFVQHITVTGKLMKWTTIGWHFCLILLTLPALAQTPDTTSAERYYPLQVGNAWEYRGSGLQPGDFRVEIVGDTVIAGTPYYLEASASYSGGELGPYSVFPVRFDTTTANVLARWDDGTESIWQLSRFCPLSSPFGTVDCTDGQVDVEGGYDEEFELFWGQVLDGVTLKSYYATTRSYFIADLGWGGYDLLVEPGGTRLSYARIDGVEYGEPFPVAAEDAPLESDRAFAVYPNPSRGGITARMSLDRPQRVTLAVYDVLGRRVLADDLGVHPAGEASHRLDLAALPAGVYVVRLDGDAGAWVTARIVRQK